MRLISWLAGSGVLQQGKQGYCRTKVGDYYFYNGIILYVFVYSSERTKSPKGDPAVYRLKDWPSGEEFLALMPSRLVLHTCPLHTYSAYSI